MKVVIAMDSLKGTISAVEACERIRDAIHSAAPDVETVLLPMADGGEGTASALMTARSGEWIPCKAMGPLPEQQVDAGFVWFAEDQTAVIEMASASGIMLLTEDQLNPLKTTTYGTGECMGAALDYGARRIILAVGGSATVDGGVGAAMALGWQFLNEANEPIGFGGEGLREIARIVPPEQRVAVPVEVLCDVDNPLTGPDGAAAVFGPQKGATAAMVDQLDEALRHWADCARQQLDVEIDHVPGAGAAGGLSAGMIACADAKLVPGIDTVMEASGLRVALAEADWVISGEGRFDEQSLRGKVVSGVLRMAQGTGAKVGVIAGSIQVSESLCREAGLTFAWAAAPDGVPLKEVSKTAKEDLSATARRFAQTYLLPNKE